MIVLWRWAIRILLSLGLAVIGLLIPPAYVELACQKPTTSDGYSPLITDPNWQRAESRTLLTYPEWHIVHAYDDYARVIRDGDPHDFGYLRAISGFWRTLCPLTGAAASMGGVDRDTKATIYTIGVSFTAELLAKAAYEETIGRLMTLLRGSEQSALDAVSARQAAEYALFLQQTPWYQWDFRRDAQELTEKADANLRDRERSLALGIEYRAKAIYAGAIKAAVAGMGADQLRLRAVVSNLSIDALEALDGITVVGRNGSGIEIETDRYRAFTRIVEVLVAKGGNIVEIAGNNDVLFTAISDASTVEGALYSFPRQGYGDVRHLILIPVRDLGDRLRSLDGLQLEHVHDY